MLTVRYFGYIEIAQTLKEPVCSRARHRLRYELSGEAAFARGQGGARLP